MPEPRQIGTDPGGRPALVPGRKRWQVGLPTLLLLMAAIAVWMTFLINREQNARLRSRINVLRSVARELDVSDPRKIAVVKMEEYWYDENRWEIYLPSDRYQICLATRKIGDLGLAPAAKSQRLSSGRHRLGMDQRRQGNVWRVTLTWDGAELLTVEEPEAWDPGAGSMGGSQFSTSEQVAPDKPAILFRRRFMSPNVTGGMRTPAKEPSDGIQLWIEPLSESNNGP